MLVKSRFIRNSIEAGKWLETHADIRPSLVASMLKRCPELSNLDNEHIVMHFRMLSSKSFLIRDAYVIS